MGVGGQRHASAALLLGKTRFPLYRRLGGSQGRSGQVRNISSPPGFDPQTVQPVDSRYAYWDTPASLDHGSLSYVFHSRHSLKANAATISEQATATSRTLLQLKADSHIACRAHAVPLQCRATKCLECVFPIWFIKCGCVWYTLAMPRACHALTMPFFSRPRPVGYLPAFGFSRLPRGVPRRLLSEAYQSSSQRSIPATVKSGSSTLQKRRSVKLLD
jgi:hypothetical protein